MKTWSTHQIHYITLEEGLNKLEKNGYEIVEILDVMGNGILIVVCRK